MLQKKIQPDLLSLSILHRLKTETRENHIQIEKVSLLKRIFAEDYSLKEYTACLARFYGFYAAIEPVIYQNLSSELSPLFEKRSKLALLTLDLNRMGIGEGEINQLPLWQPKNYVNSLAECLGVWYVLEGSTLGGQFISQHLGKHFGDSAFGFLHFHQGYRNETRQYWANFCEILSECIPPEDEENAIKAITAAKLTFNYLAGWMASAP